MAEKCQRATPAVVSRWPIIVERLRKLNDENKLTAEQAKWLLEAEKRLAELKK